MQQSLCNEANVFINGLYQSHIDYVESLDVRPTLTKFDFISVLTKSRYRYRSDSNKNFTRVLEKIVTFITKYGNLFTDPNASNNDFSTIMRYMYTNDIDTTHDEGGYGKIIYTKRLDSLSENLKFNYVLKVFDIDFAVSSERKTHSIVEIILTMYFFKLVVHDVEDEFAVLAVGAFLNKEDQLCLVLFDDNSTDLHQMLKTTERDDAVDRMFYLYHRQLRKLHSYGLIHQDVKFRNAIITTDLKELRLIDFGSLSLVYQDQKGVFILTVIHLEYPESLIHMEANYLTDIYTLIINYLVYKRALILPSIPSYVMRHIFEYHKSAGLDSVRVQKVRRELELWSEIMYQEVRDALKSKIVDEELKPFILAFISTNLLQANKIPMNGKTYDIQEFLTKFSKILANKFDGRNSSLRKRILSIIDRSKR